MVTMLCLYLRFSRVIVSAWLWTLVNPVYPVPGVVLAKYSTDARLEPPNQFMTSKLSLTLMGHPLQVAAYLPVGSFTPPIYMRTPMTEEECDKAIRLLKLEVKARYAEAIKYGEYRDQGDRMIIQQLCVLGGLVISAITVLILDALFT